MAVSVRLRTQKPTPILIGGETPPALRRIAKYGDGFYINWKAPAEFADLLDRLGGEMAEKGRDVSELYMQLGATDVELVRAHKQKLPQYEAMGLDEIIYSPAANSTVEGLEMMRGFAGEFF